MRRLVALITLFLMTVVPLSVGGAAQASTMSAGQPSVGATQVLEGFAARLMSVQRAHEAGAADYVAGKGNIFLLVTVAIARHGSHAAFYADPADFHIQTSDGTVIDSEQFGMNNEMTARHIYNKPLTGVIGFEV